MGAIKQVRLSTFGPACLEVIFEEAEGEIGPISLQPHQQLRRCLIALLCSPNRTLGRSDLAEKLYNNDYNGTSKLAGILTTRYVQRIHPALSRESLFALLGRETVQLQSQERLWWDGDAFLTLVERATQATYQAQSLSLWQQAAALISRGPFLVGEGGDAWNLQRLVRRKQEQIEAAKRRVLKGLGMSLLVAGEAEQAATSLHEYFQEAPTDFPALERCMQEYVRAYRPDLALVLYKLVEEKVQTSKSPLPIPLSLQKLVQQLLDPPERVVKQMTYCDWGDAPSLEHFFGRFVESAQLQEWILEQQCRVIALLGMGGIGKTSLLLSVARKIEKVGTFELIFWRSLRHAPMLTDIVKEAIAFFSRQQQTHFPETEQELIMLLLSYMQAHRCLLILDNCETILKPGEGVGHYLDGYEGYGALFRLLAEAQHQSCLLLTSRETLKELARWDSTEDSIRLYHLSGLENAASQALLDRKGVQGEVATKERLATLYGGNPLALQLVAQFIIDVFSGDSAAFLQGGCLLCSDIEDLLKEQFERLTPLEQELLYWLALARESIPVPQLCALILSSKQKHQVLNALQALRRRHLIERDAGGFTLQNVVMEFTVEKLQQKIFREIQAGGPFHYLRQYPLAWVNAKEYIRMSQIRLIILPLLKDLFRNEEKDLRSLFQHLLQRAKDAARDDYMAGNVVNLLIYAGCSLAGNDFSHLFLKQVSFCDVSLASTSFEETTLADCRFTETFGGILSVAVSPDGTYIAAGTTEGEVRLWRWADGTPMPILRGHKDWVYTVAFASADIVVSGCDDRTIRVWDIRTGTCLRILSGHTDWIFTLAVSPDSEYIVSGGDDRTLFLWEQKTGRLLRRLEGHTGRVWSVAFSPDGTRIASGGEDQTIRVWDVQTGQPLHLFQSPFQKVWSVIFHPYHPWLIGSGDGSIIARWNYEKGKELAPFLGQGTGYWDVRLSPDGLFLVAGGDDSLISLWDTRTEQLLTRFHGHTGRVRGVAFHPSAGEVVSGGEDRSVRCWNLAGRELKRYQGYSNHIWSLAVSADGQKGISGGDDFTLHIWELSTCAPLRHLSLDARIWSVAFHPNGRIVASGGDTSSLSLWDIQTGSLYRKISTESRWTLAVAFSLDGSLLASGGEDQKVYLWETTTGHVRHTLCGHTGEIWTVAFSPDGKWLASGGEDHCIYLWDLKTGKAVALLQEHKGEIWSVAFDQGSTLLISGSSDQTVKVWSVPHRTCVQTLSGFRGKARTVSFSPDGSLLASGGDDASVYLWKRQTATLLACLQGHQDRIKSIAFTPDGQTLLSGSADGTIRSWNLSTRTCQHVFSPPRPYEGMNITGLRGILQPQRENLKALGAYEREPNSSF